MATQPDRYAQLFPACAGMNRHPGRPGAPAPAVPRVRGDEPDVILGFTTPKSCSPRARG